MEEYIEDYRSLNYEDWCDLLSIIKVKYKRKRASTHTKKIASDRSASLSNSNESVRILRKKKARTDILRSNKGPKKRAHKNHITQRYCVLCKKAGMPERKYMLHSSEDCTGIRTNRTIKDGLGGSVGIMADTVNQYKKYKKMEEGAEISQEAK